MDYMLNAVKSPDLINLVDTDGDGEVQYKSLQTANGIVTSSFTDADEFTAELVSATATATATTADAAVDDDGCGELTDDSTVSAGESPSVASSPTSDGGGGGGGKASTSHAASTMCEERCQLLDDSDDERQRDTDSLSTTTAGSLDVWTVSDEQRRYYTRQFATLQPRLDALLDGGTAKAFFEKSKLPVSVLSQIWNLADVTKDGCLCLQEFITAMHLVVLQRNNIAVPRHLPATLIPTVTCAGDVVITSDLHAPPTATSSANNSLELASPRSREWTKFIESPLSGVSSPGARPANFDFQKSSVEQNPSIVYPVAVRGTREEHERLRADDSDTDDSDTDEMDDQDHQLTDESTDTDVRPTRTLAAASAAAAGRLHKSTRHRTGGQQDKQQSSLSHCVNTSSATATAAGTSSPPTAFLRVAGSQMSASSSVTTAADVPSVAASNGPASLPACRVPAARVPQAQPQPPPPPPPRPQPSSVVSGEMPTSSHARSSSLDLGRIPAVGTTPPVPPPRTSPPQMPATQSRLVNAQQQQQDLSSQAASNQQPSSFADFAQFDTDGASSGDTALSVVAANTSSRHTLPGYYRRSSAGAGRTAVRTQDRLVSAAECDDDVITASSAATAAAAVSAHDDVDDDVIVVDETGAPTQLWRLSAQQLLRMTGVSRERLAQLVRIQRQRTLTLAQVAAELNQELTETIEERAALEIQLQHMSNEHRH